MALDDSPQGDSIQGLACPTEEDIAGSVRLGHFWAHFSQISFECLNGVATQRDDALFGTLSETFAKPFRQLDVFQLQTDRFRSPATGCVKGFQQSLVPKPVALRLLGRIQEPVDHIQTEDLGDSLPK